MGAGPWTPAVAGQHLIWALISSEPARAGIPTGRRESRGCIALPRWLSFTLLPQRTHSQLVSKARAYRGNLHARARNVSNQSLEDSVTTETVAFARHYAREKFALV